MKTIYLKDMEKLQIRMELGSKAPGCMVFCMESVGALFFNLSKLSIAIEYSGNVTIQVNEYRKGVKFGRQTFFSTE